MKTSKDATNITLKFHYNYGLGVVMTQDLILTLDETGKHCSLEAEYDLDIPEDLPIDEIVPKRIMRAFTAPAVLKIFAKDEIPNETENVIALDGDSYDITITVGTETKEYHADDFSVETYPLLRYIASWYRVK